MGTVLALLGALSLAFSILSSLAFGGTMSITGTIIAAILSGTALFWPPKQPQGAGKLAKLSAAVLQAALLFLAVLFVWKFGAARVVGMVSTLIILATFGLLAIAPLLGVTKEGLIYE